MFKSSPPQTEMFTNDNYTRRVVGYLKVLSQSRTAFVLDNPNTTQYWFGVNYEGKFITKKDTVDDYMPSDYILDCTKLPAAPAAAPAADPAAAAAAARLKDFGERTGLTITQSEIDKLISNLKTRLNDYTNFELGTVPALPALPALPSTAADSNATIFNLLGPPDNIAFFLVDLATNNLYTCKKDGNKFIVDWNSAITVPAPVPADWSKVWSYIPFCTVKKLSAPKNEDIIFYPRTKTKLTGDKFNFDAVSVPIDYRKIPPPFNLAIYNPTGTRKTFQEVLAAVQKKLGAVASTEASNASETNNRQLAFVKDLKYIGCNGEPEEYILDEVKCSKINALMEKLTPPTKGGRRSKRNKHRRNKRTVSRRGRGHKRSRRVDGGSRKCGKKCRRKYTRK